VKIELLTGLQTRKIHAKMTYKVERAIDHIWGYLEEELREKELLPKMRETSV